MSLSLLTIFDLRSIPTSARSWQANTDKRVKRTRVIFFLMDNGSVNGSIISVLVV